VGKEYWSRAINFEFLVEEGTISPGDLSLIQFVETAQEAWDYLCRFYSIKEEENQSGRDAASAGSATRS
jgi:predicted Rossmann-fold nucleotide-binding protein